MSLSLMIGSAAQPAWYIAWGIPIAAPILTFMGVAWGIVAAGKRQIVADDARARQERTVADRQSAERQAVARTLIYAQMRRARLTARGHIKFMSNPSNSVLYIAIYRSLFPALAGSNGSNL